MWQTPELDDPTVPVQVGTAVGVAERVVLATGEVGEVIGVRIHSLIVCDTRAGEMNRRRGAGGGQAELPALRQPGPEKQTHQQPQQEQGPHQAQESAPGGTPLCGLVSVILLSSLKGLFVLCWALAPAGNSSALQGRPVKEVLYRITDSRTILWPTNRWI